MNTVGTISTSRATSLRTRSAIKSISLMLLAIAGFLLSAGPTSAQTYLSEDFEGGLPSTNFSAQGTGTQWAIDTVDRFAGTKSARFQTNGASNGYLVSKQMDLSGSVRPLLTFQHIAALEKHGDQAYVEVSKDGGVNWSVISNSNYYGNSFRKTGEATGLTWVDGPFFDAQSRPEWDVNLTGTASIPTSTMWKKEVFDLTPYKSSTIRIRLRVKSNAGNDWYGWLVDNVQIAEAPATRISGVRVIGGSDFPNFSAAAQALADSGIGTGGVTFLVTPGTYTDSVQFGSYLGSSAANRVRFKANGYGVYVQRYGSANTLSTPSYTGGWTSTTYFWDAVALLSGSKYLTFDGITFQQANIAGGDWHTDVGVYMTNGCLFDSVVNCTMTLNQRAYYTTGFMIVGNYYQTLAALRNIGNKFVNDTINSWNGAVISSYNNTTTFDSLNEINATTPGGTFFNLGPTTGTPILGTTTVYGIQYYCESALKINNMKMTMNVYGTSTAGPTCYGCYGYYVTDGVWSNNQFVNWGAQAPTSYRGTNYGIYFVSTSFRPKILNNTFSDWYGNSNAYAIYAGSAYEPLVQGNTVTRFTSATYGTYCMYFGSTTRPRVIGNRIKDIRLGAFSAASGTTFYGMYFSSATSPLVIYNNMISDISLNNSAGSTTIYGMYFSPSVTAVSGAGNVRDSICYNSIYLSDTHGSTGTAPTSTSYLFYHLPSAAVGYECYLLNNIFSNRQTNGTGSVAYAYYRSSTSTNTFSDFNDLYTNTTGPADVIHRTGYNGGTICYQLSDWKTSTANNTDIHSFAELPPWSSTDSLHLTSGATTRLAQAGKALATITTDFDGTTRSSAPVIGAHEGSSLAASATDDVGPAITYVRFPKVQGSLDTVRAIISDPSGVASGANTSPLLYYRAVGTLIWSNVTGSNTSGNNWAFQIPSQTAGTRLQYYIAAQDNATTANASTWPNGGSGTTPPGSTAPTTLDSVTFVGGLSGDYLVGGAGATFSTLKAALDSVNAAGLRGATRLLINANLTEVGQLILNGPILGSSTTNTLTIKPNTGVSPTVNPTFANIASMTLNGVSNVIFDGSNTTGGSTRDMTWSGGSNSSTINDEEQFVVQDALSNLTGVPSSPSNLVFKNMYIRGGYSGPAASSAYGVFVQHTSATLAGGNITDVVISNNSFSQLYNPIRVTGTISPDYYINPLKRFTITNNLLGPGAATTDSIWGYGMYFQGVDSVLIDNNDIQRMYSGSTANTMYGIYLTTATQEFTITRNKIHNMKLQATGGSLYGIYESSTLPPKTGNFIANNMIYDMHQVGSSFSSYSYYYSPGIAGIFINAGINDVIANNTVYLFDTTSTTTATISTFTEALGLYASVSGETLVNNIFYNYLPLGRSTAVNAAYMGYYSGAQSILFSNNNIWNAPGQTGLLGYNAYNGINEVTFDSLRNWTGGDGFSWNSAPPFVSASDAHIATGIPTRVESGGIPVAGITTDIDGNPRNVNTPDIGAHEGNFTGPALADLALAAVVNPSGSTKIAAGTGFRPVVTIRNDGTQTLYNIPITDKLTDSSSLASVTITTIVDSIRGNGDVRTITLDSVSIPSIHVYGQRFWTNYATDGNRSNDSSAVIRLQAVPVLSGLYTVGVGQWAPTLKAAFDSLVNNGISGNVTFSLTDANYNQVAFTTGYIGTSGKIIGASASRRLRIKPASGVSPVINLYSSSGVSMPDYWGGSQYPGLGLLNTSFLTIDGSNTENGSTRDMTIIQRTPFNSTYSSVIGMSTASNDSVKNCNIQDSTYYSGMSGYGLSCSGIYLGAPSGSPIGCSNIYIYNNWIHDAYYDIYNVGVYPACNSNINITGNKITRFTYGGIYSYPYGGNTNMVNNTIQSDTTAPIYYQYGIYSYNQYSAGASITGNRIWKLRSSNATAYFYGMYLNYGGSAGQNTLVANNLVALDHDTSTGPAYVYPLYLYGSNVNYGFFNLYYNTFYVGGTATISSPYMIQHQYTGGDVLNNVFVWNRSTAPSSYFNYDYNYYNNTQNYNNNVYFIGSSSTPTFAYYYNGSTSGAYSFSTWQSSVGKDIKSYFESQRWQDSVGGNFAPVTNIATRIESHGTPIPGITTDINGNTRNARYPDIGAYEGNYTPEFNVDLTANSFTAPAALTHYFTNTSVTSAATFTNNAINTASNIPILYQAIDASGAVQASATNTISSLNAGASSTAGNFTFTPLTPGIWTIKAIAQAPNEEYTLDDTTTVQISVTAGMTGGYTVGVGRYAPTIKAAFDSLTKNGTIGAVNFSLMDASYSEPAITGNIPFTTTPNMAVSFKPAVGVTPTITFNPTVTRPWGIRLNSTQNYTFDGSNAVGGTGRNTTFQFAGGNNANGQAIFWLADSLGGNGASGFTVKNSRIISGGTGSNIYGVFSAGSALTAASTGVNNSETVQNNEIRNAGYGIWTNGSASTPNTGNIFTQNQIGPLAGDNTNRIGVEGIRLANGQAPQVTMNEITGVYSNSLSVAGIDLATNITGATVSQNKIHEIESYSGVGRAAGIVHNGGSSATIANNMIWHVFSLMNNASANGTNAGIYIGAASGDLVVFNSVSLTGNRDTTGSASTPGMSAAFYVTSAASTLTAKNNIFGNLQTEGGNGARSYGYVIESTSSLSAINNDDVSGSGPQGTNARIGATDYTRMQDIRLALGGSNELNGFKGIPPYVSDADLHINPLTPSLIESGAVPIPGITTDIDGNIRNVSTPDVGAAEGNFAKAVDVIGVAVINPPSLSVYRPFAPTTAPIVTFRNGASGTGTNIPVTLVTYDSLVGTTRTSSRTIPVLGPNASVNVTFDSLILPDIGSYGVYAYSNYGFDVDNTNDTTAAIVVKVCAPMFGTYFVGQGRDFPNLTVAARTLRDCGVQSRVNLVLTDAVYNEPFPIQFTGITGLTGANTVTVKPNTGVNVVMNIPTLVGQNYTILLDSTRWLTIDGSNTVGGNSRNWTINALSGNPLASIISVADGSRDTIKNLTMTGVSMNGGAGITLSATRTPMVGNVIMNNDISTTMNGIVTQGSLNDSLVSIFGNTIHRWSQNGIQIGNLSKSVIIRYNMVRSDTAASSTAMTGIQVAGVSTNNVEITGNKVMAFNTTGTNPVLVGISLANTGATATRVFDNWVSLGRITTLPTATMYGIQVSPGTSSTIQNNTVALGGTGVTSGSSYAIWTDQPANMSVTNNIFANMRSNAVGATGINGGFYNLRIPTGNYMSDYNDWFVNGNGGLFGQATGTNQTTLVMWRMFTNGSPFGMQDRNSFNDLPNFVSTSDLHVTPAPSRIQNGGMPNSVGPNGGLDYDIDNNPRAYIPDVGASEFSSVRNNRVTGSVNIGTDYPTFQAFANAVNTNGVDGPVDVYLGSNETVNAPVMFVAADGLGPNAPIRIHALKNGTSLLTGSGISPNNLPTVILFDSAANNITIDGDNGTNNSKRSLTITNTTPGFANSAILLTRGSSNITIKNTVASTLAANSTIQPTTDGLGVISATGAFYGGFVQNNMILNDSIVNGWNGVYAGSPASSWGVQGMTVRKSSVSDFNSGGIFFGTNVNGAFADGNYVTTVNNPGQDVTMRGIRLSSDATATGNMAGNNWVINVRSTGSSNVSGIEVTGGTTPFIFDNFISLQDYTTGSVRGVDEASSAGVSPANARIFFNTINLYGTKNVASPSDYGIAVLSADGVGNGDSLIDNIVSLVRGNTGPNAVYAMGLGLPADASVSNYNDYYTPQGSVAQIAGVSYPTLAALRATPAWSGNDANSITGDPKLKSNSDLHLANYYSAVFNKGLFLASVPNDIDYQLRDPMPKTEIGADENGYFGALPIELMTLDAKGLNAKIDLNFATANEQSVFGFAVMRSEQDDQHFLEIANANNATTLVARGKNGSSNDYNFVDANVKNGTTYFYKIVSIDNDGTRNSYDRVCSATPLAPEAFGITGNYPNPFSLSANGSTRISYTLGADAKVSLTITDVTGRTIRSLVTNAGMKAGNQNADWDAKDAEGTLMTSGTYFAALSVQTAEGKTITQTVKMVLTK